MPQPAKHPRWTIPGRPGYVTVRGGRCRVRIADEVDIMLPYEFAPGNRARALAALRQLQEAYIEREEARRIGAVIGPPKVTRTLRDVRDEWRALRLPRVRPATRSAYETQLRTIFPPGTPNVPMRDDDVEKWCLETYHRLSDTYPQGTLRTMLTMLRSIMTYAHKRGYLLRDPMVGIPMPRVKTRRDERGRLPRFTVEEVEAVSAAYKRDGYPERAAAIEFAFRSLLRSGEVLRLARSSVTVECITVTSGKGGRVREIPVETVPGLRDAVETLLASPSRRQTITACRNYTTWGQWLYEGLERAEIERKERTPHDLRRGGEWWMEHVLGWPRQVILDIAGHTRAVSDVHYRDIVTADEITRAVHRETSRSLPVPTRSKKPTR